MVAFCRKDYIKVHLNHNGKLHYVPGDHISVFPNNASGDVDYVCSKTVLADGLTNETPFKLMKKGQMDDGKRECNRTANALK